MKLLFLNRSFPVISQTFVLDHIAHAIGSGHQTAVAALKLAKGVAHPVVERLALYDDIIYSRPIEVANLKRVVKGIAAHPKRLPCAVYRSALGWPTLTETSVAMQLAYEPDVIIANFGPTGLSAVRLKETYFPKAKVVVVFHGYDVSGYLQKHGWSNYQRMAPSVDLAVCVNALWAEILGRNTTMKNIVVHHLGVDCASIGARPNNRVPKQEILFVGRMTEKKGFSHLIAAMGILAKKGTALRVHAIGDGPLLDRYQSMVRERGLADMFVFHGAQTHGKVLSMMKDLDFLVAPSITAASGDQEGIPVVLMEAMASGIPVIATRHSGIPELVTDGESGLLVEERDDAALAASIEALAHDPELGQRLAVRASARVREHFNAAQQSARFFELVEGLVP